MALCLVVLFAGSSLVVWALALRELFGERARLLYPMLLLGLSPLLMPVSLWWAAAMQVYPLVIFTGAVVLFVARYYLRGVRRFDLAAAGAAYLLGLLFWEKALLIVVPAVFLAVFLSTGTLRQRVRAAAPVLAVVGAITALYLPIYLFMTRAGDSAQTELFVRRGAAQSFSFFATGMIDVGVPALLGGPWSSIENPQQVFASSSELSRCSS